MTFLFRRIDGVIIMFDVGSERSFRNVRDWLIDLDEKCPESTTRILVGNKADLPEAARQVSKIDCKLDMICAKYSYTGVLLEYILHW